MLNNNSSANLDLIRGLAVIFVFTSHLPYDFSLSLIGLDSVGHWGVFIFFVHTCYVLMHSLDRLEKDNEFFKWVGKFYIKRLSRLYPSSMLVVIIVYFVLYLRGGDIGLRELLSNVFLVQHLTGDRSYPGPIWTLPYEILMYIFLPALFLVAKFTGAWSIFLLIVISSVLSLWAMSNGINITFLKFIPCFLSGVFAFAIGANKKLHWGYLFFCLMSFAIIYAVFSIEYPLLNFMVWPMCLVIGFLIACSHEVELSWLKMTGALISRYSFGIYLVHVPIIEAVVFLKLFGGSVDILLIVAGTAAFSYFIYKYIEKPFIEYGKIFANKL